MITWDELTSGEQAALKTLESDYSTFAGMHIAQDSLYARGLIRFDRLWSAWQLTDEGRAVIPVDKGAK